MSSPKIYDVEYAASNESGSSVTNAAQRAKLQIEKADQSTSLHFKTSKNEPSSKRTKLRSKQQNDRTETFIFGKLIENNDRYLLIECKNSNIHVYFDQSEQGIADKQQVADLLKPDVTASCSGKVADVAGEMSSQNEDAIRFLRDDKHLPAKLGSGKDFFTKALTIAEHFLNLASTRLAFSAHGVGFDLMVEKARKIEFVFGKSPQANATNWTQLGTLDKINLSKIFLERLKHLAAHPRSQSEIKTVAFGLAMAIVHAFGHLALDWQSKASQDDKFDSIIDSVVELGVFGKSLGLVCLNKASKAWSSKLPIAGLALDSCTHEDHLCAECRKKTDASKEKCRSSNHKKEGCTVCKKPERYRLMRESFIEMVYDHLDQVTEYLKDRSHFETKTAPSDDQSVFNLHQENDPEVNPWRPMCFVHTNWCGTYAVTAQREMQRAQAMKRSQNQ